MTMLHSMLTPEMVLALVLLTLFAALVALPEYPAAWRKPIGGLIVAVLLAMAIETTVVYAQPVLDPCDYCVVLCWVIGCWW